MQLLSDQHEECLHIKAANMLWGEMSDDDDGDDVLLGR